MLFITFERKNTNSDWTEPPASYKNTLFHRLTHLCVFSSFASDSLGGPFPSTSHRCHHKPKRCLPIQCGSVSGPLPISPLLFHPNAKGSQIVMDLAQKTVKRQASFCNAITFSNRPIALYEQVRLKVFYSVEGSTWAPMSQRAFKLSKQFDCFYLKLTVKVFTHWGHFFFMWLICMLMYFLKNCFIFIISTFTQGKILHCNYRSQPITVHYSSLSSTTTYLRQMGGPGMVLLIWRFNFPSMISGTVCLFRYLVKWWISSFVKWDQQDHHHWVKLKS